MKKWNTKNKYTKDCAALNFIRVPYLMPVLFIIHFLGEEGTKIESNLNISKFHMLSASQISASLLFNNDEWILYAIKRVNLRWASFYLILNLSVKFCFFFHTQPK